MRLTLFGMQSIKKIKDMSSEERTAYYNAIAEEARTKYNLRVVKSALRDTTEAVYSP